MWRQVESYVVFKLEILLNKMVLMEPLCDILNTLSHDHVSSEDVSQQEVLFFKRFFDILNQLGPAAFSSNTKQELNRIKGVLFGDYFQ